MLYGRHLGFKGNFEQKLAERDPQALELHHNMEEVKQTAAEFLKVRAVWQFYEAERAGNSIQLFAPGGDNPLHTFHFGRQARENGLCLSDYILERDEKSRDHLAMFVVTAGEGVRERANAAKEAGRFFLSHALRSEERRVGKECRSRWSP